QLSMLEEDLADGAVEQEIQRLSSDRPALKIIQCSSDELAEHQKTLEMLEKSSGACVWNQ
ncbi:MAG: DNA polymerase III subunit epsilon, partial [Methyloprofundus sp.]|nr:DNA polymerase III subunit epsilon [Methyloprofundus sp.]